MYRHRHDLLPGFSSENSVKRLVWFERHETMIEAITREKRIKKWLRRWKLELIERDNPAWDDLAVSVLGFDPLPFRYRIWIPAFAGMTDEAFPSGCHPRARGDPAAP